MSLQLTSADLATWWTNREISALRRHEQEAPAVSVPMGVRR